MANNSISADDPLWVDLKYLRVQSAQNPFPDQAECMVFRNGRQQIPVQIAVDARNYFGTKVSIPYGQVGRFKFINYDTGVELPFSWGRTETHDHNYKYYDGLSARRTSSISSWEAEQELQKANLSEELNEEIRNDTEIWSAIKRKVACGGLPLSELHEDDWALDPDEEDVPQIAPEVQNLQVFSFWLTTTARADERVRIAVEIRAPGTGNVLFRSNGAHLDSGGVVTDGRSNSSIMATPQNIPNYPAHEYVTSEAFIDGGWNEGVYVTMKYLSIIHNQRQINILTPRRSIPGFVGPLDGIWAKDFRKNHNNGFTVVTASDGETFGDSNVPNVSFYTKWFGWTDTYGLLGHYGRRILRKGVLNVCMIWVWNQENKKLGFDTEKTQVINTVIDENGNNHDIRIRVDEGRNKPHSFYVEKA